MKTILCVEDEPYVLENHRKSFIDGGYNVLTAKNLAQARKHLSKATPATGLPDAIVLDIMLPDGNGLEYLKELRAAGCRIPIIMLTAWNESEHVAEGLRAGANDYLGKPFEYEVLIARVEAMFRNVEHIPETIGKGMLKLNMMAGQAFLNGADMLLTPKEFAMLLLFIQHEGRAMGAEYLYEKVWGQPMVKNDKAVKNMVSKLRKKLEISGCSIGYIRGEGYYFKAVK